jgi:Yip1 domain
MNLVARAKDIVLRPRTEWSAVDREASEISDLFVSYVAVLAAIPAVCALIRRVLVGVPLMTALSIAITAYVLSCLSVYVMALIVDRLAPYFAGRRDFENALKLIAYSATPVWLAGVFLLIPGLGFLVLFGLLDAVYLLWLGIPALMRVPHHRALACTGAVLVCLIVVVAVFTAVAMQVFRVRAVM